MSLQVWLPLTGHLNNQGLSNVTVTNNGATIDNNGKIGKCYNFDGTNDRIYANNVSLSNSEMTAACWIKWTQFGNSSNLYPCIISLGYDDTTYGTQHQIGIAMWYQSPATLHLYANGSELDSGFVPTLNVWYHICFTYKSSVSKLYVNGNLYYTGTNANSPKTKTNLCIGARSASASGAGTAFKYPFNGYLNDVRIYDHALSAKEVKELSKGLVLHYPLSDRCLQQMNNCFSNPRFEEGSAGWTVWGGSGAAGSAGLTTDKQWIYRKDQTYARWVANASTATSYYIMYQQPAFTGGYRSLCCICKEEHEYEITNEMMHPDWNATVGSKEKKFDKIISLGDGFYYCECNGFQQDGSNDLVAFVIHPGYKIYFSEAYLENDRKLCSDILFQTTTVYDVSGYNYHGTKLSTLTCTNDSARYAMATQFNGTDSGIQIDNLSLSSAINSQITYSFWIKPNGENGARSVYFGSYSDTSWSVEKTTGNVLRLYWKGSPDELCSGAAIVDNTWQHICITKNGTNDIKVYINGVQKWSSTATHNNLTFPTTYRIGRDVRTGDGTPYKGLMSDFRIYATALSADDVKELYNTAASLANNGTLFAYSFNEV